MSENGFMSVNAAHMDLDFFLFNLTLGVELGATCPTDSSQSDPATPLLKSTSESSCFCAVRRFFIETTKC